MHFSLQSSKIYSDLYSIKFKLLHKVKVNLTPAAWQYQDP